MVPMLTCGLLRSNFAFATAVLLRTLLMRHATSGTDSGRQGVGGWIWTGFSVEPGPVTVEVRKPPTIPTVQGTDGRAVGPIRTPGTTYSSVPTLAAESPGWRWRASALAVLTAQLRTRSAP